MLQAVLGRISCVAFVVVAIAGASPAQITQCSTGTPNNPAFIFVSHDSTGHSSMVPDGVEGPSFPNAFSFKAITERPELAEGGVRAFNIPSLPPTGGRHSCALNNALNVPFGEPLLPNTTMAQRGVDFELEYVVCHNTDPGSPMLAPVFQLPLTNQWTFRMPLDLPYS